MGDLFGGGLDGFGGGLLLLLFAALNFLTFAATFIADLFGGFFDGGWFGNVFLRGGNFGGFIPFGVGVIDFIFGDRFGNDGGDVFIVFGGLLPTFGRGGKYGLLSGDWFNGFLPNGDLFGGILVFGENDADFTDLFGGGGDLPSWYTNVPLLISESDENEGDDGAGKPPECGVGLFVRANNDFLLLSAPKNEFVADGCVAI